MGQTQSIFDDLDDWIKRKQYGFEIAGIASDKFQVLDMQGREAISRPYSFIVNLVSEDFKVDFDSVIGKSASLTVKQRRGGQQHYSFYGIVTAFEQERKVNRYTCYRVTMEPRLSQLARYRYSDYYINKSVPEILEAVLIGCGLNRDVDFTIRLNASYQQLDFVCQYEESCLAFISRMMEREGIYYYFENGNDRERMVIVDSTFGMTKDTSDLTYRGESEPEPGVDSVMSFSCRQHALPQTLKLRNYYYDNSQPQIFGQAQVKGTGIGSMEIYGEDLRNTDQANNLAKIRAEEILCRERIYEGESTAFGMRPGLFFNLKNHYRDDFRQEYMTLAVEHEGSQNILNLTGTQGAHDARPFYQCHLTAIPSSVQYRPERSTPRPQVVGTMSGFIDGPSGERQYADLDDRGRYKIWFPFRRQEPKESDLQHQSGYVRFAAPNAGPESGMHFPLRKDSEVMLSFAGGNPDLPIIMSAVANNKFPNMVTSDNYMRNVLKTRGRNLLEMVDTDQQQMIRMMTPVKNSVISIGNQTRVLDNPAGQKTQSTQHTESTNGTQTAQSMTPATNTDGPGPENLQLYTEGNSLQKSGGYTRLEAGSVSTADQIETRTPVPGDIMTAVSNDAITWVGRNEHSRIRGYILNQVGSSPVSDLTPTPGSYTISLDGNERHRAKGYFLNEVGVVPPATATPLPVGAMRMTAQDDISFETPKKYSVKCLSQDIQVGDKSFVTFGNSHGMTIGTKTDIFLGQAFTSNLGPLERVFVGARSSIFLALKMDFNLLKSEWNLAEEKITTFEKKGVVTGVKTCATRIGNAVTDMVTTAIANRIGGMWMYV